MPLNGHRGASGAYDHRDRRYRGITQHTYQPSWLNIKSTIEFKPLALPPPVRETRGNPPLHFGLYSNGARLLNEEDDGHDECFRSGRVLLVLLQRAHNKTIYTQQ